MVRRFPQNKDYEFKLLSEGRPFKMLRVGMRRTTLRGWENLNKRFKLAAAFYNLSQLMRKLFGFGTPKQLAAALKADGRTLFHELAHVLGMLLPIAQAITKQTCSSCPARPLLFIKSENPIFLEKCRYFNRLIGAQDMMFASRNVNSITNPRKWEESSSTSN
jgi:hypothetical protein